MSRSDFIVHTGGILFKVYIVGETIQVVRRFSLPDVNNYDMENNEGIFRFPRVSCATNNAEDADIDPSIAGEASLLVHLFQTHIIDSSLFFLLIICVTE